MDALFAIIFVVYILSAVVQALLGRDARKKRRGAGAPWPRVHPPGKTPDEGGHIPTEFPFPFPFEDVFKGGHEEEPSPDEPEYEDSAVELMDYHDEERVSPWEDKSWGSLGASLEGQSVEELERDEFYELHSDDDFDDVALMDDDIAEFMALAEPQAVKRRKFVSKSAVIQGIIMSEILKRPRALSHYPIVRQ